MISPPFATRRYALKRTKGSPFLRPSGGLLKNINMQYFSITTEDIDTFYNLNRKLASSLETVFNHSLKLFV